MQVTRALRIAKVKPNITGFTIEGLRAATKKPKYDPWERREEWRSQGKYTRWNRFKGILPGFGLGSGAFAVYCVYEHFFLTDSHHGHGDAHGHGEKH
jgi:NADH dehydrogenase (ubiquinone) 1 beta subcomplex subunit 3